MKEWSAELWERLARPFTAAEIKQLQGKDYVSCHQVIDRLLRSLGPTGWSDKYKVLYVHATDEGVQLVAVECRLKILGVTFTGYGEARTTGNKTEELFKNAESDSLKRAARKFGIALHLWFKKTEPQPKPYGKRKPKEVAVGQAEPAQVPAAPTPVNEVPAVKSAGVPAPAGQGAAGNPAPATQPQPPAGEPSQAAGGAEGGKASHEVISECQQITSELKLKHKVSEKAVMGWVKQTWKVERFEDLAQGDDVACLMKLRERLTDREAAVAKKTAPQVKQPAEQAPAPAAAPTSASGVTSGAPAPAADDKPSDAQFAKMQDFWARLLTLGKSAADLTKDLQDNYGASSLGGLKKSQAHQWFGNARAILQAAQMKATGSPPTATVTRARRGTATA